MHWPATLFRGACVMDKTLEIIIAATIFLIMAMTLIFSTTDALGNFGEVADTGSQVCQVLERDYDVAVEDGNTERASELESQAIERECDWAI